MIGIGCIPNDNRDRGDVVVAMGDVVVDVAVVMILCSAIHPNWTSNIHFDFVVANSDANSVSISSMDTLATPVVAAACACACACCA